jgi:hypothetical protein
MPLSGVERLSGLDQFIPLFCAQNTYLTLREGILFEDNPLNSLMQQHLTALQKSYFGKETAAFANWLKATETAIKKQWDLPTIKAELLQTVSELSKAKYAGLFKNTEEKLETFLAATVEKHFKPEFAIKRYETIYRAADKAKATDEAKILFQAAIWYKALAHEKYRLAAQYYLHSSLWLILKDALLHLGKDKSIDLTQQELILSAAYEQQIIDYVDASLQKILPIFTGDAVSHFAGDLFAVIEAYDLPEFLELIQSPLKKRSRSRKTASTLPQLLPFTQDKHVYAITSFLSGRSNPPFLPELNSYQLGKVNAGKTKQYEDTYITARVDFILAPDSAQSALDRIVNDRDELKGKVFVGTLGLAKWVAHRGGDSTSFPISLRDLMKLFFNYELKVKTDSKRYWKAVAQLTRYLFVDLPMLEISLQMTQTVGPAKNQPRHYQEVLMQAPGVYATEGQKIPVNFRETIHKLVAANRTNELAEYLRQSNVEGFTLGYTRNALEALGGQALSVASELMTHEVLALTGPRWWLAYRVIAHLRRWQSGKDIKPEKGMLLLEALREPGYLSTQHRERTSYKEALREWMNDVDRLVDMGILEAPGVKVFQCKGQRWMDCSNELDLWISAGKEVRITEGKLEGIRVLYMLPSERTNQMREVQKRSQILQNSSKASKRLKKQRVIQ